MKSFPMFLRMDGRRVVICGGGIEAARKARLVLKTEAEIVVVAGTPEPELAALVRSGRARPGTEADLAGAALVFVGTGDEAEDARLAALAKAAGAVVNVIDRPDLCEAFTPSIVDRDPVVVAIGTEGTAPVLGRRIKTEIEGMLDPALGSFAAMAGRLRGAVAAALPHSARRAFWEWAFGGAPFALHRTGDTEGAEELLAAALSDGVPAAEGRISVVAAPPAADLMTLRAVRRLQEADVIFHDRQVDPGILEMARRDADRVCVGPRDGASAWPPARVDALVLAEARRGRRVVRLRAGDAPAEAPPAPGIAVELVPGISAARGAQDAAA